MVRGAVLFDIGHPAHVHVFRHVLRLLGERGIPTCVTARQKDLSLRLLDAYRIPYEEIGRHAHGLLGKATHTATRVRGIVRVMRSHDATVAMGVHNPYVALAGRLAGASTAVLIDSEPVRYDRALTIPFASYLLTPRGFARDLGSRQVRFDGFKELAYLHPKYYVANPQVRDQLGIGPSDPFFVARFVAWSAEHDVGQRGLTLDQKRSLIARLSKHGKVFVSSEKALPEDLRPFALPLPPERIHDVLAQASLLVSESQTMTTEAALLGTPVVQTNTLVGTMSNFKELEKRYELIHAVRDGDRALDLAESVASDPSSKHRAQVCRDRLLADKIDVAEYLTDVAVRLMNGERPAEGVRGA